MTSILLGFVGDVFIDRNDPLEVFAPVRELMQAPDILFGNLEGVCTDHPAPVPSALAPVSAPMSNLVYGEAGFDVISLANNHAVDVGYEALLGTRAGLRAQGVATCGAGETLEDARRPAVVEAGGVRVAYLAYSSTFPPGFEARANVPGLAPLRAYNYWREPFPYHAPGRAPLMTTLPDEINLAAMTEDIGKAKATCDLVVASFHWGDHLTPYRITDHEHRTARQAIDAGADMVVGHHHHSLRGMDWFNGKPIMYGLSHFVFDLRLATGEAYFKAQARAKAGAGNIARSPYEPGPREGWPLLPFHEDARMTMFAWASANRNGVAEIGFVPCVLTADGVVHPCPLDSAQAKATLAYFEQCNVTQGLRSRISLEDAPSLAGHGSVRVVPLD